MEPNPSFLRPFTRLLVPLSLLLVGLHLLDTVTLMTVKYKHLLDHIIINSAPRSVLICSTNLANSSKTVRAQFPWTHSCRRLWADSIMTSSLHALLAEKLHVCLVKIIMYRALWRWHETKVMNEYERIRTAEVGCGSGCIHLDK
jgi:hypothetical protein